MVKLTSKDKKKKKKETISTYRAKQRGKYHSHPINGTTGSWK